MRHLSKDDERVLTIYRVDCGKYVRLQHGYRCKTGAATAHLKGESIRHTISEVEDSTRKEKLLAAYLYLVNKDACSYGEMITLMQMGSLPKKIPFYELFQIEYIETAIWPLLYPYKRMCESSVGNGNARMSLKRAFILKVLSPVVDYSMDYALLQFNYDRWLYKTISGAIEAGRRFKPNPYKSLDGKSFSPSYWKWQHLYLEDAVKQFGPPTIFIAVNPCEWTFPLPKWLEHFHDENGWKPFETVGFECLHTVNVLQEIARAYLCGKSGKSFCRKGQKLT